MLLVLLNWAYIGITAFLAGFAVLAPFGRKISEKETGYVCRTGTGVLMAGLAFITVYAQVFSLFSGVGLWANVLLKKGRLCRFAAQAACGVYPGKMAGKQSGGQAVSGGSCAADGLWTLPGIYACGYGAVPCPGYPLD